ncbi:4-hydroxyphenylacetaldehyde oxime monooxygenase [Dichanthelium oligosanthes]|uniref:4-hydroxyphenylacetaldehyde oxime monooxygenase n=1 Tax=Dichanthelium oligosanthes TaxID=888268 RepID=A0A1E5UKG6_9POAL|nr:4-hydroxyphenylacetaldehyde oxime monooxygenase [Dichanthelium oligosanthes]
MAISLSSDLLLSSLPQQQWQPVLLLALVSVVSGLLLLTRSWSSLSHRKGLKLPPGPAKVPLLGNLLQLGPLPHRTLRDLARIHGPVMQLQLGKAPAVVMSSAEAAWEALRAHDLDCCTRPVSPGTKRLTYDLKNVAFAPYGAYWREVRKLLTVELLSAQRVKAAWYARHDQVEKLISTLSRAEGKPVALDEHILSLSDGIIGMVAFGNIYGSDKFSQNKNFQDALDDVMEMLSGSGSSAEDLLPRAIGRLVDRLTGFINRRERIFRQLDAFFEMVIEQHLDPKRALPENGGDFVDVLIDLWKKPRGTFSFTRDHVKAIIFSTFVAGIDTNAATIVWAMSELVRKPRVLNKVQAEIRAVVGGNDRVQPDDMSKLSYLRMVVKETLRLHPPTPLLLPRETMRDIQIGGYDVPAKTRIYVNAWAISRDPLNWPDDPEEFNPDRFFEAMEIDFKGEHPALMPFGTGRRICPGMSMATATVEYTLANLLFGFQWALPEGMTADDVSMEEEGRLVCHRKTPLVLVPTVYRNSLE